MMIGCIELETGDSLNMFNRRNYDTQMINRIKKKLGRSINSIMCRTIIESKYRDIILKKTIDMKTLAETIECARVVRTVRMIEPNYIIFNTVSTSCDIEEIPPTNDIMSSEYSEEIVIILGMSFHFKQMDPNEKKYILDIYFDEYSDMNIDEMFSHLCINNAPQYQKQ